MTQPQQPPPFDPTQASGQLPQQQQAPSAFDPGAVPVSEEVDVDFSGVSDDFEAIPESWYLVAVDNVRGKDDNGAQLLSKKGEPKVVWTFRVEQGEMTGRLLWVHTNVAGKSAFGLRRILKAFHGDELPKSAMRINLAAYRGRRLWIYVGFQKDAPEYNEIKKYRPESEPPEATSAAPFSPSQESFAQRI